MAISKTSKNKNWPQNKSSMKNIIAVTLGNGLEMYDFIIYSFFSAIIGKLFFPSQDSSLSFLLSVATFGVGFLARPLGSLILGSYADRYGRKAALTLIIGLMALGTLMISIVPTYAQIGIWAPIILVIARVIQGFSAGGEIGASTAYLIEAGDEERQGLRVSWQMVSQGAAALLGAITGVLLSNLLSPEQLESWGWRLPFVLGLTIIPIGMYIRLQLNETHVVKESTPQGSPLSTLWQQYKKTIILGVLVMMKLTTSAYIVIHYMPSYLINILKMPADTSYWSSVITSIILMIFPIFSGLLVDKFKSSKMLLIISFSLSLILIYPMYWLISEPGHMTLGLLMIALEQIITNLGSTAFLVLFLRSFPIHVRASGLAIIYGLGVTIFGGFAQFNVTLLLKWSNNPLSPAWYLILSGVISLLALLFYKEVNTNKNQSIN